MYLHKITELYAQISSVNVSYTMLFQNLLLGYMINESEMQKSHCVVDTIFMNTKQKRDYNILSCLFLFVG